MARSSQFLGFLVLFGFLVFFIWVYPIEDGFTRVYVWIQVALAMVAFIALWRKKLWDTYTNAIASMLTVIGIFGTFLGIYRGLQVFEVQNIDQSIEPLLDGLKLAFLTSLVGIGSAVVLKFAALFQRRGPGVEENPITVLNQIRDSITAGQTSTQTELQNLTTVVETNHTQLIELQSAEGSRTRQTLKAMETAIAAGQSATLTQLQTLTTTFTEKHEDLTALQIAEGDRTRQTVKEMETALAAGQSEALAQLQNLTTTFAQKHDLLVDEFQAFSQNLADSIAKLATEELIDALKTVIEDFNAKLTEQFGDNFKQLNEAVRQTVEWQEQYRQQMSELISQMSELIGGLGDAAETFEQARGSLKDIAISSETIFEQVRSSLENIASSLELIADRSNSIVTCAESLETMLQALSEQLEAFNDIQRALEQTQTRMVTLTEQLGDRVHELNSELPASMGVIAQLLVEGLEPFVQDYIQFTGQLQQFTEELRQFMGTLRNIRPDDEIPF